MTIATGLKTGTHTAAPVNYIDYVPGAAVAAGTPVQIAGRVGIADRPIAADDTQAALAITGDFDGVLADDTVAAGDIIGWDADGDPYGGTVGSGTYTNESGDWDFMVGQAVYAATNTSGLVTFKLNEFPNANVYQDTAAVVAAAAALTQVDITDSSGGVDPGDDTIAVVTNQDTLTDSGAGTADDTVEDVADIALSTGDTYTDAAVNAAVNTAIASISNNFKEWTEQQVKQVAANTAITAAIAQLAAKLDAGLVDAAEIRTQLNATLTSIKAAGLMASS